MEKPADVAILVALEEELQALRSLLPGSREVEPPLDPWIVYEVDIPATEESRAIHIVFTRTTEAGQLPANTLCGQIIPRWQPRFIFVIGIAAAPKKKDPRLGDIVIGRRAYYYVPDKVTDTTHIPRHRDYPCSRLLCTQAVCYARHNPRWYEAIQIPRPAEECAPQRPTYDYPKFHEGTIASGESLIRSEAFMNWLVDQNDQICAAEMEAAGFCHAAEEVYQYPKSDVLIIRAITDYGDKAKSDAWRGYACEAAATYALGIIRERLTPHFSRRGKMFPLSVPIESEPARFLTSFIGRKVEIAQIGELVMRGRMVTLRGMGGLGKSRLADEVAMSLSKDVDDNIFFVELARTQDSQASVVSELVVRLGIDPSGFLDEETALQSNLQKGKALLVLDNFEAVPSAVPLIGRLLRQCPGLRFLLTSQRLLGLIGEQQFEVLPMAVPVSQQSVTRALLDRFDSFKLFRERARLKRPDWEPTSDEAPLVAEILELTDGLPLSIELAAARVDSGPLAAIKSGLSRSRVKFLEHSGPTIEEKRHTGIRACIDWSFNLLSAEEQALFPKLSVFAGGFFAEDVAQVCQVDNASALLESLWGQSLLVWEESLGQTRYKMLPTVQEYAAEKLGNQAEALRRRHAKHFLEVLDRADREIRGKEQMAGLARITADLDNIRAGMETARQEPDHRMVVDYSLCFDNYLQRKNLFTEKVERTYQGLSAAQELKDVHLIARRFHDLGVACQMLPIGDRGANIQMAITCYETALLAYSEGEFPVEWALIHDNLGNAYSELPIGDRGANMQKAIGCFQAAFRVYTEREFPRDWARTQDHLGTVYERLPIGDRGANIQKAIDCYEAALRVFTEHDFPVDWAGTQVNLGIAQKNLPTGDRGANMQKGIACFKAALRVFREQDFPVRWAGTQNNLGNAYAYLPTGDRGANMQKGIACFKAALRVFREQDFPVRWAGTQNNLGLAYADRPTGDRGANLAKAIACCEAALRGFKAAGLTEEAGRVTQLLALLKEQ